MDIKQIGKEAGTWIKKYKYVALVLAVGILLMLLPGKNKETAENEPVSDPISGTHSVDMTQQLQQILSSIDGVGDVKILLSIAAGEKTEYQVDETITTSETGSTVKKETVIITDGDRAQKPLISQVIPQVYLGAVVICEGGDQPAVKFAVVDAVSKITGLGSDKISVLKMK